MDRKQKILRHINKNGHGIEIGPSHNPIAPKKEGYDVQTLDHLSREDLLAKYQDHQIDIGNIEDVDFIWNGEEFSELTGKNKYYDWIIASHVIEHTPDFIGFLNSCDTILKDNGVISLAVPDKRYCFDYYRPITGISTIIDRHFNYVKIHTPGTVAEYFLNVISKGGKIAWDSNTAGEFKFVHSLDDALQGIKAVLNDKTYLDVHAWCFVPHSFRLIIHDLFCLGLIHCQEIAFYPTEGSEFFITLGRNGEGRRKSRLEILSIIDTEIQSGILQPPNEAITY